MISARSTISASANQVSSELAGEVVVLDLGAGVYHGLDPAGARVWSLVQQPATFAEVRDRIVAEYDVAPARCEADLLAFLRELESKGLVEACSAGACCCGCR